MMEALSPTVSRCMLARPTPWTRLLGDPGIYHRSYGLSILSLAKQLSVLFSLPCKLRRPLQTPYTEPVADLENETVLGRVTSPRYTSGSHLGESAFLHWSASLIPAHKYYTKSPTSW